MKSSRALSGAIASSESTSTVSRGRTKGLSHLVQILSTTCLLNSAKMAPSLNRQNGRAEVGITTLTSSRIPLCNSLIRAEERTSDSHIGVRFMTGWKTMGTKTSAHGYRSGTRRGPFWSGWGDGVTAYQIALFSNGADHLADTLR